MKLLIIMALTLVSFSAFGGSGMSKAACENTKKSQSLASDLYKNTAATPARTTTRSAKGHKGKSIHDSINH